MRIGQMKRERIHPQSVATSAQAAARLTDSRAADNFRNLFELPVLFYVVALLLAICRLGDAHRAGAGLGLRGAAGAAQRDPVQLQQGHAPLQRPRRRCLVLWALWGYAGRRPAARMNDADELEFKRLRWRCRRGMRELDQLLGRYLDREWRQASEVERGVFLRLLETEDDKLWHWFMGYETATDAEIAPLVERIRTLPP